MTKTDLQRVAEQAESHCEFDRRGGPPVVVVNWAGASIIYSTFKKPNFWAGGVALGILGGGELWANIIVLRDRYGKGLAYANLEKLAQDALKALTNDGIAIVCTCDSIPPAEIERMKCEERGHVIQNGVERKAQASPRGFGWYEDLYDRPEARSQLWEAVDYLEELTDGEFDPLIWIQAASTDVDAGTDLTMSDVDDYLYGDD